jgi:DNA-binding transcriptional MerR regulator
MSENYPSTMPADSGWVTTRVVAAALGVKPRQVRNYISEGLLVAKTEGEGVNRRYLVSADSVTALRSERHSEGKLPGQDRDVTDRAETSEHSEDDAPALLVRELASELGDARYLLGRAEARLELTTQAESTLREALERERDRADRAERRLEELELRLTAAAVPREAPETAAETSGNGEGGVGAEKPVELRSWLYRFFFGP